MESQGKLWLPSTVDRARLTYLPCQDIFGHIVELKFSCGQHGFIQQNLEEATDEEKQHVFDEIVPMQKPAVSNRQKLSYIILVELLAYQFTSPAAVRHGWSWIQT